MAYVYEFTIQTSAIVT